MACDGFLDSSFFDGELAAGRINFLAFTPAYGDGNPLFDEYPNESVETVFRRPLKSQAFDRVIHDKVDLAGRPRHHLREVTRVFGRVVEPGEHAVFVGDWIADG